MDHCVICSTYGTISVPVLSYHRLDTPKMGRPACVNCNLNLQKYPTNPPPLSPPLSYPCPSFSFSISISIVSPPLDWLFFRSNWSLQIIANTEVFSRKMIQNKNSPQLQYSMSPCMNSHPIVHQPTDWTSRSKRHQQIKDVWKILGPTEWFFRSWGFPPGKPMEWLLWRPDRTQT